MYFSRPKTMCRSLFFSNGRALNVAMLSQFTVKFLSKVPPLMSFTLCLRIAIQVSQSHPLPFPLSPFLSLSLSPSLSLSRWSPPFKITANLNFLKDKFFFASVFEAYYYFLISLPVCFVCRCLI